MAGGAIAAFCVWVENLTGRARLCAAEPSNAPIQGRSKNANAAARPSLVRPTFMGTRLTRFTLSAPRLAGCELRRFMVWLLHSTFLRIARRRSRQGWSRFLHVSGLPAQAQLPVPSSGQRRAPLWAHGRRVAIAASA